jgi:AraC family transcriptional regulator
MERRLGAGAFFGRVVGTRAAGGFLFSESVFAPETRLPTHAHENPFFYLVLQGASTEVYGRSTRRATPTTLVFHPAGEPHANHWHGEGGRCFHLEILPTALSRLGGHAAALTGPVEFGGGLPVWLAMRLAREFEQDDALATLALEGLALELLVETARNPVPIPERTPPRWLRCARDLLHARFAEGLSLGDVAAAVDVHPARLAHVFRRHQGCTVGDYLRRLRVEFAGRQLAASELPLVEIALAAGFADQSHFCKCFKRHTGLAPTEFRRHFGARKPRTNA